MPQRRLLKALADICGLHSIWTFPMDVGTSAVLLTRVGLCSLSLSTRFESDNESFMNLFERLFKNKPLLCVFFFFLRSNMVQPCLSKKTLLGF